MIRVAICDDEAQGIERAHSMLKRYNEEHPQYDLTVVTFSSGSNLLSYVEECGGFDVFLLDVYMKGILGTEVARQLRHLGYNGEIIFITTSRDHALDAFEVNAAQYLIKPYATTVFFSALDKVFYRLNIERFHFITLKTSAGITRLFTRSVVYAETGRNNYQIIHTVGKDNIEVRMTSAELFELLLPAKSFARCGASIILNLRYVRKINKVAITFDSGAQLTYPYRVYQKLKESFLDYQMSSDV